MTDCRCTSPSPNGYIHGCYYMEVPASFFGLKDEMTLRVLMCFCTECISKNHGIYCPPERCVDHCKWDDYGLPPEWDLTDDNYMDCTDEMADAFNKTIAKKIEDSDT
jgi:hypothetical protein